MIWLSILIASIVVSDAIVQVNGFKPFMFAWKKKEEKTKETDIKKADTDE